MAADHVRIYGLQVDDPALYRRYRDGMTPILHRFGGAFGYDFAVAEVLEVRDRRADQPGVHDPGSRIGHGRPVLRGSGLPVGPRRPVRARRRHVTGIAAFDE